MHAEPAGTPASTPFGGDPVTGVRRVRFRGGPRRAPFGVVALAGLVAIAVNLPLLYLAFRAGSDGPAAYFAAVMQSSTMELLFTTVALAAAVVTLATILALPLAWLVVRTDLPFRRAWALLAALPLVFPSYVSAFTFLAALGPTGYVQRWLEPLGVTRLPDVALGFSGATLALALFTYPYLYLLLVAALRELDPALEESARTLGLGARGTFVRVVLPQLRGPLAAGGLLVALYTVSDFGAVSLTRCNTLTLGVYNAYRSLFDRTVAASMGSVLALVAFGLIALQVGLLRGVRPSRARLSRPPRRAKLGRWRTPCTAMLIALHAVTLALPLGVIGYWGIQALAVGNPLGSAWSAAWNSVAVSLVAAAVTLACSLPPAVWSVRYPSALSRTVERLGYTGQALPGLIIALAFVFFATRHAPVVYQTLPLLVAAYAVRFLPQALSASRTALQDVPPAVEEAARSLGSGPVDTMRRVTLPMMRNGLFVGLGLVFLTCMKELPATLILRPIGLETLATRVWSTAAEGIYSEAAVPALLLVLASAVPVYWLTIRPVLGGRGEG